MAFVSLRRCICLSLQPQCWAISLTKCGYFKPLFQICFVGYRTLSYAAHKKYFVPCDVIPPHCFILGCIPLGDGAVLVGLLFGGYFV